MKHETSCHDAGGGAIRISPEYTAFRQDYAVFRGELFDRTLATGCEFY